MQTRWGIWWIVALLGFPIGGLVVTLLIGHIDNPLEGFFGGALAGVVIGAAQMLALRQRLPINWRWVAATAAAMAIGVGLSIVVFGTGTTREAILMRAPLTGLLIGIAQWLILRDHVQRAYWWIAVVAVVYTAAWAITALVIGESVDQGFVVFGSSGALAYQLVTGWVLGRLTASPAVYSKA